MNSIVIRWIALIPGFLLIACSGASAAGDHLGHWEGVATAQAETTAIRIRMAQAQDEEASAVIDLPSVGVKGWPAQSIQIENDHLALSVPSDSGAQTIRLRRTGERLIGSWTMPGFDSPARIALERVSPPAESFSLHEVSFHSDGLALSGTVILPSGRRPLPGVVFLHGSGDTTRHVNRFAAEELAARGIASIIFDKRGTGRSAGQWRAVGFEALARDGVAAAQALLAFDAVDPVRVGFSGQSQGGWIGPLAASMWKEAAFVIALSGPATTPAEEGHWTVEWALTQHGFGAAEIEKAKRILRLWDQGVRSRNFTAFEAAMQAARTEPWFVPSGIEAFSSSLPDWVLAWYARILDFDPVPVIREMKTPMLSILGSMDASIPAARSAEILRGLAGEGVPVEVIYYEGYDHSLRKAAIHPLRWPHQPHDLYEVQSRFIHAIQRD